MQKIEATYSFSVILRMDKFSLVKTLCYIYFISFSCIFIPTFNKICTINHNRFLKIQNSALNNLTLIKFALINEIYILLTVFKASLSRK